MYNYTLCVKLHTVCQITHCVSNYTLRNYTWGPFVDTFRVNCQKIPLTWKFFPQTPQIIITPSPKPSYLKHQHHTDKLINVFLSTWCRERTWNHRERTWNHWTRPSWNHRILHPDIDSDRLHPLRADLHVPNQHSNPEELRRDPEDLRLLPLLRGPYQNRPKLRLRAILRLRRDEDGECHGGKFWFTS